jgi:hypothetical protein
LSTDQGGGKRREGIPAVGDPPCLIALGINPSVRNKSKSTEPWPIFALIKVTAKGGASQVLRLATGFAEP